MKKTILALTLSLASFCMVEAQLSPSSSPDPFWLYNSGNAAPQAEEDDNTGNVGIGTQAPTANLHIVSFGNASTTGSPFSAGGASSVHAASANAVTEIDNLSGAVYSSGVGVDALTTQISYAPFSFIVDRIFTASTGSPFLGGSSAPISTQTTDMIVDQYGNTGIGLASPAVRLDVYGASNGGYDLFQVANDLMPALYVTAVGKTGLNTSSPLHQLDVRGDANVQTTLNVGLHGGDGGNIKIWGPALGPYSYAEIIQVSDPNVKALAVSQECQSSGCTTFSDKFVVFADGRTAIGDFTGVPNPFPTGLVSGGNTIPYMLYVNGAVLAQKYKCALSSDAVNWSDYVFDKDYNLLNLDQVKSYIDANHHLPDVPSTDDVLCDGIDLAQIDATLLKKIEELTLYMLQMKKDNEALKAEIANLKK